MLVLLSKHTVVYSGIRWSPNDVPVGQSAWILATPDIHQSGRVGLKKKRKPVAEKSDKETEENTEPCQSSLCGFGWV